MALLISLGSYAQKELNIGLNGGFTIGDIDDKASAGFGLDGNYLFDWFNEFKIGPSLGVNYYLPKDVKGKETNPFVYVPIGGAVRFQPKEEDFYVGLDFGYAIGVSPSGDRGGVYFKPMVGYSISEGFRANLFYSGVKKKIVTYSYIGLGLSFDIFSNGNLYSY